MTRDGQDIYYTTSGARFSPDDRWWYYPDMTRDEMLVFKGFDSALGDGFKTLYGSSKIADDFNVANDVYKKAEDVNSYLDSSFTFAK